MWTKKFGTNNLQNCITFSECFNIVSMYKDSIFKNLIICNKTSSQAVRFDCFSCLLFCNIWKWGNMVWLPRGQLSTTVQMKWVSGVIDNRTVFNNEIHQYNVDGNKRSDMKRFSFFSSCASYAFTYLALNVKQEKCFIWIKFIMCYIIIHNY